MEAAEAAAEGRRVHHCAPLEQCSVRIFVPRSPQDYLPLDVHNPRPCDVSPAWLRAHSRDYVVQGELLRVYVVVHGATLAAQPAVDRTREGRRSTMEVLATQQFRQCFLDARMECDFEPHE